MVIEVGLGFLFFWRIQEPILEIENNYERLNTHILRKDHIGIESTYREFVSPTCVVLTFNGYHTGLEYFSRTVFQVRDCQEVIGSEVKIKERFSNGNQIRCNVLYLRQLKSQGNPGEPTSLVTDSKRLCQETWQRLDNQWRLVHVKVIKREVLSDSWQK